MKKKCITKQSYERFVRELENTICFFNQKYKEERKEDVTCYNAPYLTGWYDGAIYMCKIILDDIKKFKDENQE